MFLIALYNLPIWGKKTGSGTIFMRQLITIIVIYTILYYVMYSGYTDNIEIISKYKQYVYYSMVIDIVLLFYLFFFSLLCDPKKKSTKKSIKKKNSKKLSNANKLNSISVANVKKLKPTINSVNLATKPIKSIKKETCDDESVQLNVYQGAEIADPIISDEYIPIYKA